MGWDVESYFDSEPGQTPDGLQEVAGLQGFEEVGAESLDDEGFFEEPSDEAEEPSGLDQKEEGKPEEDAEEDVTDEGSDLDEEDEEDEEDEADKEAETSIQGGYMEFAKGLQSLGYIPDDEDLEGLDYDSALELAQKGLDNKVDEGIESVIENWKEGLGDKGKEFIQFTMAGGKPEEFFSAYAKSGLSQFDISSSAGQEQFLRHYLKNYENLEPDEIEDRIQYLEDTEKTEQYASKWMDRAKSEESAKAQKEIEAKSRVYEEAKKRREQLKQTVKGKLAETKEVNGFSLKTLEKKEIYDFLFEPTVKTEKGYVTPFADKFRQIAEGDPEKLILLGKIMKSDFDFSEIEERGLNKANNETKKKLQRAKEQKRPKTKNPQKPLRAVWEDF